MPEAMATIRAELGEEAVILSTRRVAGGVEVTVALEPQDEVPPLLAPAPIAAPSPLARHNLPAGLAARLGDGAGLGRHLAFAPLPLDLPLLLAGPAGAGKTLTAAKLAARLVLSGTPPLLVTADGRRAGAAEQLAALARVLDLELSVAAAPPALAAALTRRRPGQAVLVDMPACDPFDAAAVRALAALRDAARGRVALVLPAGLDAEEAAEVARAFHLLGARHLLPRLDAARRLGGVLAAAAGLALTEAGTGTDVAAGLTPITPEWLAARLAARGQGSSP